MTAPPRMRVLMTADTVGGVWTYALELCRALEPFGVEVGLATKGALLSPDQRQAVGRLANVELFESAFRLEWMEDPWDDVRRAEEWLRAIAARFMAHLAHLNDYAHGALDLGCPKVVVGHSCLLSWWRAVRRSPVPASWDHYREVVSLGLRGADAVVAPSRAMLGALRTHYGAPPGRVIAHGRRDEGLVRRRKEPFVLTAGRLWDDAKNVAALERIAPRLPWPVFVAGAGRESGGRGTVRALGRLSSGDLWSWFARAAIYAFPARYEPYGLSVLEAALAGCALVLGDIESLRELWDGAAVFVDPDSDDQLREALRRLAADPPRLAELGAAARARAQARTPRAMAEAYHALYQELSRPAAKEAPACVS